MMHQELQLVPALSVAENVFLGIENRAGGLLRGDENERLADMAAFAGFDLDPDAPAGTLSIADQQKVEIMRALARDARVIVMDEPNPRSRTTKPNAFTRRCAASGARPTIIYVSHFLDNVLDVCDRVTLMRGDAVIRTAQAQNKTKATLVAAMIERSALRWPIPNYRRNLTEAERCCSAFESSLPAPACLMSALICSPAKSWALWASSAAPHRNRPRHLRADASISGQVLIEGTDFQLRSPRESVARGIAMVPEDRRRQDLVLTQPVRPNMTLPHLHAFSALGLVRGRGEKARAKRLIEYLGVHPATWTAR